MTDAIEARGRPPLISVAMPTYDPEERYLREAIESVLGQRYRSWELCVADDGSRDPRVARALEGYAAADPRIRVELGERNSGIAAASNRAVAMCRGEYVAFLDHDDAITADALLEVSRAIERDGSLDVLYSDQDKLNPHGARVAPFHKPDWSPVYALGAMYVGHLLVVRRALIAAVGGFDSSFDGIQDFELMLRISERTDRIRHPPRILYHWRAIPGSIAAGVEEKSGIPALQARAVSDHLRRRGIAAAAEPHPRIPHRAGVVRERRRENPPVSVIVPATGGQRELDRCLDSVRSTTGPSVEAIVEDPSPSRRPSQILNRGAARASGEQLLFLAPDAEIVDEDWIDALLAHAELPGVGVVGPLTLYPDGRVREAGLALRRWESSDGKRVAAWWHGGSPAEPMMRGADAEEDGYYGSLSCAREVGAVSAACMLVSRAVFERAGGFDEEYRARYHDVDLCLRVGRQGLETVYAPRPRVIVHELPPLPADDVIDRALLIDTWFDQLDSGDPYLNPHLTTAMKPAAERRAGLVRRIASRL
jgi:GT2 family glycosyltransferase